ncbi:MAG: peptidylprolyl isomerase [Oligoflexales bacterium]
MYRFKRTTLKKGKVANRLTENAGVYTILLVALGAMTFMGVCTPQQQVQGLSGIAATVDGEEIHKSEFRRSYQTMQDRLSSRYGSDYNPAELGVARRTLEELIRQRLLYQEAVKHGVEATEDDAVGQLVRYGVFDTEDGLLSEDDIQAALLHRGFSEASLVETAQREITLGRFENFLRSLSFVSQQEAELQYQLSNGKVEFEYIKIDPKMVFMSVGQGEVKDFMEQEENEARMKGWFETHEDEYSQEKQVKASHILIAYEGSRSATAAAKGRTKEEALKLAESVLKKANKKKSDFAALAKKYTDDPSGKDKGGDLGFFTSQAMVKPFSEAAFAMNVGDVSQVVESPFGFHIIKVTDKKEAVEQKYEDAGVKTGIAKKMIEEQKRPQIAAERAKALLDALMASEKIDTELKDWNLGWAKQEVGLEARYVPNLGTDPDLLEAVKGLHEEAPVHPGVIDTGDSRFVVRLVKRKNADMSGFAETKERTMDLNRYMKGNSFYQKFVEDKRKDLDLRKAIHMNPEYLLLDQQATDLSH